MNASKIIALVLTVMAITSQRTQAQVYLEEVNGRPIRVNQYINVEGSPYLLEEWSKGTLTLADGTAYKDIVLKYEMVEGLVLFRNKQGIVLEPMQPVTEFTIYSPPNASIQQTRSFVSGAAFDANTAGNVFYEVLATGPVGLLKRNFKVIREEKAYSSASITKKIAEITTYHLRKGNDLIKIKNEEKSVLAALSNQKDKLKAYLSANNLNLKKTKT
ncbi:hypothetical protein ACFSC6_12805 [Rufibacter sediminis]|uniref:DUF4369 domain-containing protein n=1 Tax=Rufibacter sediminis TaxID=2762756 RepID=A0ABR6VT56_9BACT|nr:hypothetical protein [Rufibacter sediminis]MBC3540341.1 hypothetical protein [Rufibacter sediminis]